MGQIEKMLEFNKEFVTGLIDRARQEGIKLTLLWFATWKNGSNHYMPEWMKREAKREQKAAARVAKREQKAAKVANKSDNK